MFFMHNNDKITLYAYVVEFVFGGEALGKKMLRVICVVLALTVILSMTSCSKNDGAGALLKYGFTTDPKNLDPQLALDTPSLNVIQNMFEGLMKVSADGTITNGVAESYQVSADGLKYTFYLKENAYWIGKNDYNEQVTADDFVFAFQRLLNPVTKSPFATEYYCIKNAQSVNESTEFASMLGVKALSDFVLEFELEYPNADFLSLLTKSSSMPCNREFFYSTKGKYGLETSAVISNGAFYLHQWLYDPYGKNNYLILRKNQLYSENSQVYPAGLNYFVIRNEDQLISDFLNDKIDFIVDDKMTKTLHAKEKTTSVGYEISSSGIIFNMNKSAFQTQDARKAFAICIDRSLFKDELPKSAKVAYGLIPSGVTMLNKSFRELSAEPCLNDYNRVLAQYLWESSFTQAEKTELESASVIVPESYPNSDYVKLAVNQWGEVLGFYCAVEVLPDSEYNKRILSGDFYFAIQQIRGTENSAQSYLSCFSGEGSLAVAGYFDEELDAILDDARARKTLTESLKDYQKAEKLVCDSSYYIPLFYEQEYLIYSEKIKDVIYNPFTGQIDFSIAKKF